MPLRRLPGLLAALVAPLFPASAGGEEGASLPELETFRAAESSALLEDSLIPTERGVSDLFGGLGDPLEIPRSLTVVPPRVLELLDIRDLGELGRYGAGTQRFNTYGIAGAPIIRGIVGGVYFNGMLRAFNRNEMPLSFGSFEAIEIVKGPAPVDYTPTQIGGFVNLLPKTPYFDESRGSLALEVDSQGLARATVDQGGPTRFLDDMPAAYRLSVTGQYGPGYYNDVRNDYVSLFGAVKARPAPYLTLHTGGEFYGYSSNENVGWNRPTRNLVDNGRYLVGEPVNMTSAAWGGTVNRNLVEFPGAFQTGVPDFNALVVPAARMDAAVAEGRVPAAARGALLNLANPDDRARAYGQPLPSTGRPDPAYDASGGPPEVQAALREAYGRSDTEGYRYTREYFERGGEALTTAIEGDEVLADPDDYADSTDFLWFGDLVFDPHPDRTITLKNLFEYLATEKKSSYGYAVETEQLVLATKLLVEERGLLDGTVFTYGGGFRYTRGEILQDFFAEPFGRRDISTGGVSANSVVRSGPDRAPDGLNLWSPASGANVASDLYQAAVFAVADTQWTERLQTTVALRFEQAWFDVWLPSQVDRRSPALEASLADGSGDTGFVNASFSPVFTVVEGLNLYATLLEGTTLDPTQAGAVYGEENFARGRMQEVGVKASLLDGDLYASLAAYWWEQSRFNDRDAQAEPLEGEGVELEVNWQASRRLTLVGSAGWQEVRRQAPLGFRTVPLTPEETALSAGVLNSGFATPANNPDLVYPGSPQTVLKLLAVYEWENGFGLSGGPIWQDAFYLNFDRTIELPAATVWNLSLFYRQPSFEVLVGVENLFDEDYYLGSDPLFGANAVVTKAPGPIVRAAVTWRF